MPKKRRDNERPFVDGKSLTLGELSHDLIQKDLETDDPIEMQQEMQYSSYEHEFETALERAKKKYADDFYLVVLNQRFRIFSNVIRTYFVDRISCPTPDYDQAVYRYDKKSEKVEFLWVIPDKHTCEDMYNDMLIIDEDYRQLLNYVLEFYDGTLLNRAKKFNNEEKQSLVLVS